MVFYLALFLLIWAMIFTAVNFIRYYRIQKEYKGRTTARVEEAHPHQAETKREKKEKKSIDVTVGYEIDGIPGRSEIRVPATSAEDYKLGTELPIRYKVSPNGAVHIASDTDMVKKLLIGHGLAFVAEIVVFVVIWVSML